MVVRSTPARFSLCCALLLMASALAAGCASSDVPATVGSGGATGDAGAGAAGSGAGGAGSGGVVGGSGGAPAGSGGTPAGSGGTTPIPDAAAPADGAGGAAGGGCGADQVCFDFENGAAGAKPGTPWAGQGTIDAVRAVSGKNSLRVAAGGDNAFAMLKPSLLPIPENEYYGRVMFWVENVPSAHWTFVRSRGPVAGKGFTAEYTYGGSGKRLIANYDTQGVASDCWKNGGMVPLGKWACMEWHFKGATNELEMWIDGVADPAHVVGKGDGCIANGTAGVWNAPTFSALELGFAVYGATNGLSVWYDDLALGKAKVGCPAR